MKYVLLLSLLWAACGQEPSRPTELQTLKAELDELLETRDKSSERVSSYTMRHSEYANALLNGNQGYEDSVLAQIAFDLQLEEGYRAILDRQIEEKRKEIDSIAN